MAVSAEVLDREVSETDNDTAEVVVVILGHHAVLGEVHHDNIDCRETR